MRARSGFTLIEILIVVIILGILAAIVIPQFSDASTQARVSSVKSDLQTMRSQIELYKVQHKDALPGTVTGVDFTTAMTGYTDIDGVVAAGPGVNIYGPYLQQIPSNPFNNLNTVRDESGASTAGLNTYGWVYNTGTGAVQSDDDGTTDSIAHITY